MRKWHRWITVLIAVPMLFIALTGVGSHIAALWPNTAPSAPLAVPPAGFECPEGYSCRPRPVITGPRAWVGFLHHLHSGEEFGPIGTAISILAGFALIFFAISGMWMYLKMFAQRRRLGRGKIFWK